MANLPEDYGRLHQYGGVLRRHHDLGLLRLREDCGQPGGTPTPTQCVGNRVRDGFDFGRVGQASAAAADHRH